MAAFAQLAPPPPSKSCCECTTEDEVTENSEFNFRDGESEREIEEFHWERGDERLHGLFVLQIKRSRGGRSGGGGGLLTLQLR